MATPSGARAIGSLKVGDQVTAYDPATGKSSTQTVQHVWVNHDHDLLDVTLHEDGQDGHATEASSTDKTQQVATKAHGSQAPPSSTAHDETIHTTKKHPWLTTDRGWVKAGDLRLGEHVVELGGRTATIAALAVHPGAADYYNLTVSTLHIYAVGVSQAVVHNCANKKPIAAQMSDLGRDTAQEILEAQGYPEFVHEVQFETPGGKPRVDLATVKDNTLIVAESKNGLGARLTPDPKGGYPYFINQDVANIFPVGPNAIKLGLRPGVSLQAQGIENIQFFYFRFDLYPSFFDR